MGKLININEIANRITYHIRKLFIEHQEELRTRNSEETIKLDEMVQGLMEAIDNMNKISDKQEWIKAFGEIEKNYFNKYRPTMNVDGSFRSDNVVLSEQNIDELMGLVKESIGTVRLEELPRDVINVSGFVRETLRNLRRKIEEQEEGPDKKDKIEKIDKYLVYYMSLGDVGVTNNDVIYSTIGEGKFFEMKRLVSDDILLSVGMDGTIKIDKGAITMETLTRESLEDKITTSELSEFESSNKQQLESKTDVKGENRDD